MRGSEAELERLRMGPWRQLPPEEKREAICGIVKRVESGEFADPAWVPTFAVYLRDARWRRPLRPKPKPPPFPARAATKREQGLADFRRRLARELEEANEDKGLVHRAGSD